MGSRILRTANRGAETHVRQVTPVPRRDAEGVVARVYDQLEADFGLLAPPVTLHSPAPEALAASWAVLRESLVATGALDRATKEAVSAAVSLGNACPYCVQVHTATLHGLRGAEAHAVAEDRLDALTDPLIAAAARWARLAAGRDEAGRVAPPVAGDQVPELVGTAATFHYLNRVVNVFLVDSPLPPKVPAVARRAALGMVGKVVAPVARRALRAGESLELLAPAPLPPDLGWAAASPAVSGAFARAAAAFERAGERSVPASARDLVADRLSTWDGRPPPLSSGWIDEAVGELPPADRPAGRLALLVALASYRVDQSTLDGVRATGAGDRVLVEIAGWASFAAARTVASWSATGPARARDTGDAGGADRRAA